MQQHEEVVQRQKIRRGPTHEGPKNHFITFGISAALTVIAFLAAANESLSASFVAFLLVAMAIVQALFQLFFWMHMKDNGHRYAKIFVAGGFIVALTAVAAALLWIWW